MSRPEKINNDQGELFKIRLKEQLNPEHPLSKLEQVIDWRSIEEHLGKYYEGEQGQPPKPVRLMVGLLMLQYLEGISDYEVVEKWVENPYWQYFCGYDYLQWELPIHPSSMTRWRKRLGEKGVEKLLEQTIESAVRCGKAKENSLSKVIVDTTVQEKAIAYPVDAKLLNRAREKLVKLAQELGLELRQSYRRVGRNALAQAARYGHARQYRRMARQVKKLKTYLGRTIRDVERKIAGNEGFVGKASELLSIAKKLLQQEKHSKNKLYSLHAPEVECIGKGKVNKTYEFGCKTSLVVTHREGLVLSAQALHGNPYDGHTLSGALAHAMTISKAKITQVFADRGYRGHGEVEPEVILAGRKKLPRALKKALKRRNAIEPHIGHMKRACKLGRNYLKGRLGDRLNALLVGIGYNLRLILKHLRIFFAFLMHWLKSLLPAQNYISFSSNCFLPFFSID